MSNPNPKFSIIMPTFNRPEFLFRAVQAILNQDYQNWELIIQDGGQEHANLPSDPRIFHFIEKDRGITDAMNRGLRRATGDIFNWSNDDDEMAEGALKYVAENIGEAKWAYGVIVMKRDGVAVSGMGEPWDYRKLKKSNFVPQPTVFWTREAYEAVGEMDEQEDLTSDYEYWLRLGLRFTPKFFPNILAIYNLHPNQITQVRTNEQLAQAEKTKKKYENLDNGL